MKRRLVLLRHGETGFPGKYIGASDVPLAREGISQIAALKSFFHDQEIDLILSSPMKRCRQCAELLFPERTVSLVEELREIDFGRWEGLSFSEIEQRDPELVQEWANWSSEFCFPEGEQINHFLARIHSVGTKLLTSQEKNTVLIGHGGVIRALICYLLKLSPDNFLLFQVDKGRIATLDLFSEGGVLTGLNLGAGLWES